MISLRIALATIAMSTLVCCKAATPSPAGGMELIIAADGLTASVDFDTIQLTIQEGGNGGSWVTKWNAPLSSVDAAMPGLPPLPATFAIVTGSSLDEEALITVTASKGEQPVVQRTAQVQLPANRVASLWLVLAKSCVGTVEKTGAEGPAVSTCATGMSCQPGNGQCGSNVIANANELPTYVQGQSLDGGIEAGLTLGDGGSGRDAARDATNDASRDGGRDSTAHDAGEDASRDGGRDATAHDAGEEASADATVDAMPDTPAPPLDGGVVADAFSVETTPVTQMSTGYGSQTHVIYATNDKSYWLFYVLAGDAGATIQTLVSKDFRTWSAGTSIMNGYPVVDGNNFSVAYANIGGSDVVHVVANTGTYTGGFVTVDVRATIASGTLSRGSPIPFPGTSTRQGGPDNCGNDGPSVSIARDGYVYAATGWSSHPSGDSCDTNIFRSTMKESGAMSGAGAFENDGFFVSIPDVADSHALLSLPDADVTLAIWPDQANMSGQSTAFESFGWALSSSFTPGAGAIDSGMPGTLPDALAPEVFTSGPLGVASYDDWAVCQLGNVHLVRHLLTSASSTMVNHFEEAVYGGSTWQLPAAAPPQSISGTWNTGVALVSGEDPAKGMLLVTIGAGGTLYVSRWLLGVWQFAGTVHAPMGVTRNALAGTGCGSHTPAVFWTESSEGGPAKIMGANLSSLL